MPQPLFIRFSHLRPIRPKEVTTFINDVVQKKEIQNIHIDDFPPGAKITTDIHNLWGIQPYINNILEIWYEYICTNNTDAEQQFSRLIKEMIDEESPKVIEGFTIENGIIAKKRVLVFPPFKDIETFFSHFFVWEILETLAEGGKIEQCQSNHCNNFFIQQGRRIKQIYCSDRCLQRNKYLRRTNKIVKMTG